MRAATVTLIASLLAVNAGPAMGQESMGWSVSAGLDFLATERGTGSAVSAQLRRTLGTLPQIPRVDVALGWMSGSSTYSPFECHLARQVYCFGGSERLRALDLGLTFTGEPFGSPLGVDISPVAGVGANWSRLNSSETEGPTTLCLINGEIVSCPDNPPFQQMTGVEAATLPSFSYGLSFTRAVGKVDLRLEAMAHSAGVIEPGHRRLQLSLGLGF